MEATEWNRKIVIKTEINQGMKVEKMEKIGLAKQGKHKLG